MKAFYVATTANSARFFLRELFKEDPACLVSHLQDCKSILHVWTNALKLEQIFAMAGVAHVIPLTKQEAAHVLGKEA